ncbi:hypothetical protein [Nocardia sp.]|uniref:hypothetical protein n=1 Tax=Nocardia sp. TaxID=1821 RepID=UPI0026038506|nr:hypothetical protein [Nocardia sp.]
MPAIMACAGERMWYHPAWFARHIPDLDVAGAALEQAADNPAASQRMISYVG